MKFTAPFICLFVAFVVSASESSSIYHAGWIDLNKNGKKDAYEDSSRPVAKRVNDLLKRMTLDEKIGQLWQVNYGADPDKRFADKLKRGEVSSFLDGSALIESPVMRNKLQHIAVEQSRLGIPLILGHDVIHGFRTVFPISLAEACAWEPGLLSDFDSRTNSLMAGGNDFIAKPFLFIELTVKALIHVLRAKLRPVK